MRTIRKVTIVILLVTPLSSCVRANNRGLITSLRVDAQGHVSTFSDSVRGQELWLHVRAFSAKVFFSQYSTSPHGEQYNSEGKEVVSKTPSGIQWRLAMPHRWQDVVQVQGTPELKGRGKYGKVFLVHVTCGDDPKVKQVAVKEVKYDSENETQALSVQMEASCLKILSSNPDPHFPRYLRQFTDPEDGKAWIMTQWASGGTFRDLINGGKENRNSASHLKTRLWLFYDMMRGLEQLHDNGMVHRDLKPANLLVSEPCEGPCRALIGDLGLICHVADKKKEVVGTPSYIAPEVFDNQAATQANDVWAAGIILYELLFLEAHVRGSILVQMCWKLPAADLLPRRYSDLAKDLGSGILDSEIQEVLEGMLKGAREECSSKSKPDPSIRWAASQVLQSDFMQKVADFRTITSSKEDLSKCEE